MKNRPISNPQFSQQLSNTALEQSSPPKQKASLLLPVLITFFISGVIFCIGGYFLGNQSMNFKQLPEDQQATQTSKTSQTSVSELDHTLDNGTLLIKYGNNIYVAGSDNEKTVPVNEYPNADKFTWKKHSIQFINNDLIKTSIFDAKALPNGQGIILVLTNSANISTNPVTSLESRSIYHLLESGTPTPQSYPLLNFFSNDFYKGRTYPRIAEVSKDGKVVAFDMYGCWGCGGHNPEKMLIKLDLEDDYSRKSMNVGEVQDFILNDDNSFSYRPFPTKCYATDWQQEIETFSKCLETNKQPLVTKSL